MPTKGKPDPIPEELASYEEAADFWDAHDSADYKDILEAVDVDVKLPERHYIIELDRGTAEILQEKAQKKGVRPSRLASELLQKMLAGGK